MRRQERITGFASTIWEWFDVYKRDLPWRDLKDPIDQKAYKVMVSEVMLQQTQVSRVIVIFKRFLEEFPTIRDLAEASNKDVILAWRGLGYNSRALRLRDAARVICGGVDSACLPDRQGKWKVDSEGRRTIHYPLSSIHFPREMDDLLSIPGVGHYTAAAIRNFAFEIPTPCVDTNIRRVLHRTFVGNEDREGNWKKDDGYLLKLAGEVLDVAVGGCTEQSKVESRKSKVKKSKSQKVEGRSTADWHAALMDYGSMVQTKNNVRWGDCWLSERGLMKARPRSIKYQVLRGKGKKEPGRSVGSKFIPNRIFRGKIVEELRDSPSGLPLEEIGRRVCIDWDPSDHRVWLKGLVEKLKADAIVGQRKGKWVLAE